MFSGMRSSGIAAASRSRSGAVSSSDRGGETSQPPVNSDSIQCRPERNVVQTSVRMTCSMLKFDQTSSRDWTPSRKHFACAANAVGIERPGRRANQYFEWARRIRGQPFRHRFQHAGLVGPASAATGQDQSVAIVEEDVIGQVGSLVRRG